MFKLLPILSESKVDDQLLDDIFNTAVDTKSRLGSNLYKLEQLIASIGFDKTYGGVVYVGYDQGGSKALIDIYEFDPISRLTDDELNNYQFHKSKRGRGKWISSKKSLIPRMPEYLETIITSPRFTSDISDCIAVIEKDATGQLKFSEL